MSSDKVNFSQNGVCIFPNIIQEEMTFFQDIYQQFLDNAYDLTGLRSDLSGNKTKGVAVENITQIMRPSLVEKSLLQTATYDSVINLAKHLLGDDMEIDFDMLINKAPQTNTRTPWHQDAAYWPSMPDKRALSFWVALDDIDKENGCMMYIPASHLSPIRPHYQTIAGGALQCDINDKETIFYGEISAGQAIAHHGYTLHAALGNASSSRQRRALIINLRPKAMIDYMRKLGYNHLGGRKVRNA